MHYRARSIKRQQGVVIVVALFIVALAATMAYVMMARLSRDTRRTELVMNDTQAELYAKGSVIWAKDQLRNDWIRQKKDKLIDKLPIESPVNEVNGYAIQSTIKDAQGKFNINNVQDGAWQQAFERLIRNVYPQMTGDEAREVVKATFDWIMPGSRDNQYSKYYAQLPEPYRAPHHFMADISELKMVKGVTPELYEALKPYIIALPEVTPINALTAEPPVLALISPEMSITTAKQLGEMLHDNPPVNKEMFLKMDIIQNHKVDEGKVDVVSSYFLVETEVKVQQQDILLYTLLHRKSETGRAAVSIIWQNRGMA